MSRALRAAVFAMVCVLASLGMHVLAGGAGVRPITLLWATGLTGVGAYLLARRRRGFGVLLPAAFAAQYGMHRLFGAGAVVDVEGHHSGGLSTALGMLLAHALVASLSAWWLERGENALATLVRLLACSLFDLWRLLAATLAVVPVRPVVPVAGPAPVITGSQILSWTLCRRGPPRR
ncbi:hypothetical protein Acor_67310 [Acrocarpospora corrugata]|uniref:Uncharacterized protein n=1 Tax=Acrocarpospora corrugata TaxID=35763 RepID=A0A5M3WBW6_9ACTN|nr:hypothetical protein [Acrocarpospora corrugata]GES04663.1 hypothetical protein Acor_67310 [Acrocarpospora corrugata]